MSQGGGATGTYTATGNILTKSTALSVKANRNCNVKVVGTFFASYFTCFKQEYRKYTGSY